MLCLLTLSTAVGAQTEEHFLVTRLADDLLMLSTDQGSYSNNSLVFTGPDGLLLVDTHGRDDAEAFKSFIEGLDHGSPKYIINTHRHVEHIGGNHLFGAAPLVVTHKLFPEKLRSGTFLFAEYPPETFPDITFEDSLEISFNGELIHQTRRRACQLCGQRL
jgi:glyoxylase-like metal-dependent hydrolase (beta-lactamase superfamily II)